MHLDDLNSLLTLRADANDLMKIVHYLEFSIPRGYAKVP
jgi:hypothetical protein